ncbi:MAG: caspase family protein [Planctomycetaceae bacterium]|nr:caspase family protein [Planctomycetaceae bacterium]
MRIFLPNTVVCVLHLTILFLILFLSGILSSDVNADWTKVGNVNGVQVYRDNDNNLEWTRPLNRAGTFQSAQQQVTNLGFRLPTHHEFRSLERNKGIRQLGISTGYGRDFFWESTGRIVNGYGGNFASLLPPNYIRLVRDNWVIGVRDCENPPDIDDETDINNETNSNKNIRVLVVLGTKDERPKYQSAIEVTRINLLKLLNTSCLQDNFITLENDDTNADKIIKEVRKLCREVGKDGAVLVYYAGHGATIKNYNGKKNHYLAPFSSDNETGALIPRSVIYNALLAEKIRFVGLITDSCSNVTEAKLPDDCKPKLAPVDETQTKKIVITNLAAMLLYARGSIDIGSSDPDKKNSDGQEGQFAFYTVEGGSVFTREFSTTFQEIYVGNGRFVKNDFKKILESIEKKVNSYQERIPDMKIQEGQNIHIFDNKIQ